jgi:hypothetical protein
LDTLEISLDFLLLLVPEGIQELDLNLPEQPECFWKVNAKELSAGALAIRSKGPVRGPFGVGHVVKRTALPRHAERGW